MRYSVDNFSVTQDPNTFIVSGASKTCRFCFYKMNLLSMSVEPINEINKVVDDSDYGSLKFDGSFHYDIYSGKSFYYSYLDNRVFIVDKFGIFEREVETIDNVRNPKIVKNGNIRRYEKNTIRSKFILTSSEFNVFVQSGIVDKNNKGTTVVDVYEKEEFKYLFSFHMPDRRFALDDKLVHFDLSKGSLIIMDPDFGLLKYLLLPAET
jgi:archaellum component FlaG (FlaF/FlaG flagellin family)